jgi:hypothetical protein
VLSLRKRRTIGWVRISEILEPEKECTLSLQRTSTEPTVRMNRAFLLVDNGPVDDQ